MPTVFITGANRGLGLEFVRQYATDGWRVIAACRKPRDADELQEVPGAVEIHKLDVTDHAAIRHVAEDLDGQPIDVLINNAGIGGKGPGNPFPTGVPALDKADAVAWEEAFRVNSIAPFLMSCALLPNLEAGERKTLVVISSTLGSITDNTSGGQYPYRSSKAAVNMVVRGLACDLADRDITVVALNPGWVRTRLGGTMAPTSPGDSIDALRRIIERLTPADSGRFYNHDGAEVPW